MMFVVLVERKDQNRWEKFLQNLSFSLHIHYLSLFLPSNSLFINILLTKNLGETITQDEKIVHSTTK